MTNWEPVSGGQSGARVWRGPGVHRKEGDATEIAAEAARLVWLGGRGIPCPAVVSHDPGVLVTTTVPGRSGASAWPAALRPRLADALADLLRSLHAVPTADCPFDRSLAVTVAAATAAVVDLGDLDEERRGWTTERLVQELHRTRPADEDLVVCHGDPTRENVLFDDAGRLTGIVDVGLLGVADRYADLAIAARNFGPRLLRHYGIAEPDREKLAFYRLLDEFW